MGNAGRSAAVVAALALLAGLALWLGSALFPESPPREDAGPTPGPADALSSASGGAPGSGATRPGLERSPGAPPQVLPAADDTDGFPTLAVVVEEDPEAPPPNPITYVYAVPAGARGRSDLFAGPAAPTDDRGCARLVLPGPGTYDVGALGDSFAQILARDVAVPRVAVPRDDPLRLLLPRFEELEIAAGPGVPVRDWSLSVTASDSAATGHASVPGRTDTASSWTGLSFAPPGDRATVRLPAGVAHRVEVQGAESPVLLSPDVIRVPGRTWILRPPGYPLKVRVRCVPAERTFGHDVAVWIQLDWGPGVRRSFATGEMCLGPNEPLAALRLSASAHVPQADGIVSWSGAGIVPGSARYQGLSPDGGKANELRVEVEIANPPDLNERRDDAYRSVRVHGPGPGREYIPVAVVTEDAQPRLDVCFLDRDSHSVVEVAADSEWALATSERGWVAGPLRLAPGALADLRLVPGGFLVAVPERMPPDALGVVAIERTDGAPFVRGGRERAASGTRTELVPGMVLGPFEPGTVEFRVRVGGADFGVVRGTVRAGTHEILRIPALRPAAPPR